LTRVCSIFSQMLQLIPHVEFESVVRKYQAERHARGFSSGGQFVAMLFCQPRDNQASLPERRPRLCGQIRCRDGVGSSRCQREEAVYECQVCRSAVSKAELLRYYAAHVFRLGFSACIDWSAQANGRLTRKVVPRELDSISKHPLKSLIRSRIPASPTPPSVFALRKRSNKARAMPRPSSCTSIIIT
jgi:hypothetical protein